MDLTLNQVVLNLSEIADKHQQIHGFKFGVTQEDFATSGVSHPAEMWVTIQPSPMGVSTTEFNVSMCLCDSVRRGNENQTEVISDMWQIAKDVVAQLRNQNYPWDFNRGQKPVVNPFKEKSPYSYAGVWFDFTLTSPDPIDRCATPFSSEPTIYPTT